MRRIRFVRQDLLLARRRFIQSFLRLEWSLRLILLSIAVPIFHNRILQER